LATTTRYLLKSEIIHHRMANAAKISILTASFNCAPALAGMASHVRSLACHGLEWIVIDGGSTDETLKVIDMNRDVISVAISEPDRGIYDAWNKGVTLASGEWILFLGTDDQVEGSWLATVEHADSSCDLLYGDLAIVDSSTRETLQTRRMLPWSKEAQRLRRWMSLPHTGMAHHRRLFAECKFDPDFGIFGDWDFLLRTSPLRGKYFPNQLQARMALGGVSNRPEKIVQAYREMRAVQRRHALRLPIMEWLRWNIKLALARWPWLYGRMQRGYWRGQLRG
jgi:glycosyltransferase involved in cell wall biosynthesis